MSGFGQLAQGILAGEIAGAQHASADGKVCAIPLEPATRALYHCCVRGGWDAIGDRGQSCRRRVPESEDVAYFCWSGLRMQPADKAIAGPGGVAGLPRTGQRVNGSVRDRLPVASL